MFNIKIREMLLVTLLSLSITSLCNCVGMPEGFDMSALGSMFGMMDGGSFMPEQDDAQEEAQHRAEIEKLMVTSFFGKHFSQGLMGSKKQTAALISTFMVSFGGACTWNAMMRNTEAGTAINKILGYKVADDATLNAKVISKIKEFGIPVIPAVFTSLMSYLLLKTEFAASIELNTDEKVVLFAAFYLLFLSMLSGDKAFQINAYVTYPLLASTIPTFIVHNLIKKHNMIKVLRKFLQNYNPDIDATGCAYQSQLSDISLGKAVPESEIILCKNNKLETPEILHKLFDEIHAAYQEKGDSILADALKKVALKLKEHGVLIS